MTFNQFKQYSLSTNPNFSMFTDCTMFLGAFVAEIPSRKKYMGLYYSPFTGKVTLVYGFGPQRRIAFFNDFSEIMK